MNHTIKGILIVVAITSMLVLGATTMVPILQNSFAHKKSDFKKAERDTNINVNRNSADSSSSSTATASNTNNINNSACTVTVSTCPKGSTSVTTPTPTPTPTLTPCTGDIFPTFSGGTEESGESRTTEAAEAVLGPGEVIAPPGSLCPPGEDEPANEEFIEAPEPAGS
jgi:hypothetical protein